MTLLHLALQREWDAAGATYDRSTRGLSLAEVGFVHCSYAHQVQGTLDLFYADEPGPLVLLVVDGDGLDVREEGGFPHLYGPLPRASVQRVVPVERGPQGWVAPVL